MKNGCRIGLPLIFSSEKITRNRLGTMFSLFRIKMLLSRKSVCLGIAFSEVITERNGIPCKNVCLESSECFSLFFNGFERVSKSFFFLRLMARNEIPEGFSLNGSESN